MLSDSRFCRKVGIAGPCMKVYTVKYIFNRIKQVPCFNCEANCEWPLDDDVYFLVFILI